MTPTQSVLSAFLKSKGEGSRGGHIVGHTKRGRAIYGAQHADFSRYSLQPSGMKPRDVVGYTSAMGGPSFSGATLPAAVVALRDGHTARRTIHEIETDGDTDGEGGIKTTHSAHGTWRVHAPDGSRTDHRLDSTFLNHPETKGIEEHHDSNFLADWTDSHGY